MEKDDPLAGLFGAEVKSDVPVDTPADPLVDEFKLVHDRLHEELAGLAKGRTEDNIGLSDPYWAKLNELRTHIHNNK